MGEGLGEFVWLLFGDKMFGRDFIFWLRVFREMGGVLDWGFALADFGNVFLYVLRFQWSCLFFMRVYLFALLLWLAIISVLLLCARLSIQQPCKELNGLWLLELKVLDVLRLKIADLSQVGIDP
jgi:hypothetical protein